MIIVSVMWVLHGLLYCYSNDYTGIIFIIFGSAMISIDMKYDNPFKGKKKAFEGHNYSIEEQNEKGYYQVETIRYEDLSEDYDPSFSEGGIATRIYYIIPPERKEPQVFAYD